MPAPFLVGAKCARDPYTWFGIPVVLYLKLYFLDAICYIIT